MGILNRLFGKSRCNRCGKTMKLPHNRKTLLQDRNRDVAMFKPGIEYKKDSLNLAFECRNCHKIYCSTCARMKLDFVESTAASASIDLKCDCGSREFATMLLKDTSNQTDDNFLKESLRPPEISRKPKLTYGIKPMDETIKYIDKLPPGLDFTIQFGTDLGTFSIPTELGMPWSTTPYIIALNTDEDKIQQYVSYIDKYFPDSKDSANDNLRVRIAKKSNGGFDYSVQADFVRHQDYPTSGGIRLLHGHFDPIMDEEFNFAKEFTESIKKCVAVIVTIGVGTNLKDHQPKRMLFFTNQRVFTAGY